MLEITIKGLRGEGKTKSVSILEEYWFDRGRKVLVVEGYHDSYEMDLANVDVLIKVLQ